MPQPCSAPQPGAPPQPQPDIEPQRMSATDVASLAPIETYAILVHLAGNPDPAVTEALIDATRRVLGRTRAGE